jgi:hypothetical protein
LGQLCQFLVSNADSPQAPEPLDENRWLQIIANLDALHDGKLTGEAAVIESTPSTLRYDIPPFPVSFFEDLAMYHCMTNLISTPAGWWPAVQLSVTDGESTLHATKKVVLTISDLTSELKGSFFELGLGLPLCAYTSEENCLDLAPPGDPRSSLNLNPTIQTIERSEGEMSGEDFCDLSGESSNLPCELSMPLEIQPESPFRLRPGFAPDTEQTYQVLQTDIEARQLIVQDRIEEYSTNWFITEGSLQDSLTWKYFTRTLDTVYTPPKTLSNPSNGQQIWLWMVVRDQRGGTDWAEIPMSFQE